MKLHEMFDKGLVPKDTRICEAAKKLGDTELLAYAFIKAAGEVVWWAYIFKGHRTWFAIRNGYRLSLSKVANEINTLSIDNMQVLDPALQKQVMFDAI